MPKVNPVGPGRPAAQSQAAAAAHAGCVRAGWQIATAALVTVVGEDRPLRLGKAAQQAEPRIRLFHQRPVVLLHGYGEHDGRIEPVFLGAEYRLFFNVEPLHLVAVAAVHIVQEEDGTGNERNMGHGEHFPSSVAQHAKDVRRHHGSVEAK
eukprot:CAMPEP_0179854304 /NCGR_PEP_ID=MMETSP0982-20121206/9858_1 /TAXON_ID=483367 /ORGANISM="non described non described, Strain CCMP 2436" /LENGTH=150 /DNA_ID=CAMNT_0021740173 /DNA_START=98 /DNA_END=551 /DNA_ORIENTATION=-